MNHSVRVGRIAGVNIALHWSLLLIGGLLATRLAGKTFPANTPGYTHAEYLVAAAVTTVVFLGCVLAHELGHAVVARRQRIGVDGITLWVLGGVTRLNSEALTPKAEWAVAGVGPLTSFVLGGAMVGLGIAGRAGAVSPLLVECLIWLGVINLLVAAFNVLPAAPLDGGHLLYAFAWSRHGDRRRALRTAGRAGEILGALVIVFGLIELALGANGGAGLLLTLVGWFLLAGARDEHTEAACNPHHVRSYDRWGARDRSSSDPVDAGGPRRRFGLPVRRAFPARVPDDGALDAIDGAAPRDHAPSARPAHR